MNPVIGILTAVREELAPIVKKMPSVEIESTGGLLFHKGSISGKPVVIARSGMGIERAENAARQMIEQYKPDQLLMCGFGGALSHSVAVGDIVVASRLYVTNGGVPPQPASALVVRASAIQGGRYKVVSGGLVTSPAVITTSAGKKKLADVYPDVLVVDMEASGVAAAAFDAGIPWLGVRAISDGADDDLPFDFSEVVNPATGEAAISRVVFMAVTRPWKIPSLIQLGGRAGLAARNLASFVESYAQSCNADV